MYKGGYIVAVDFKMHMICSPRTPCVVHFTYIILSWSMFIMADTEKVMSAM